MFVTCYCQHCDGGIEFDADNLTDENSLLSCPHCGMETKISVPQPAFRPVPIKPSSRESNLASSRGFAWFRNLFKVPPPSSQIVVEHSEGMKWILKGAALGDVQSMAHLGVAHMYGMGVSQDFSEGVKWLRLASERGDPTAQDNLGFCFYAGYGVPQNFVTAEAWFRKAAEQGDGSAEYHLGNCYFLGHGVPKDLFKGFSWWLKAAQQGDVTAQKNVGIIYSEGRLVPQDLAEAYKWKSLASQQGLEGADKDCAELASKMSADALIDARRRVETFKMGFKPPSPPSSLRLFRLLAASGDVEAQRVVDAHDGIEGRRSIPSDVRREVWRRDQGRCVKCGSRLNLEYDHIIPFSRGGSNTARNIELLCESCNRSKSASIR